MIKELCLLTLGLWSLDNAASIHADGLARSSSGEIYMSVTVQPFGTENRGIVLCTAGDGEWKETTALLCADGEDFSGGKLWRSPEGFLLMFCRKGGTAVMTTLHETSLEWDPPVQVCRGQPAGTPVVDADGRWLLPVVQPGAGPVVYASADSGATWTSLSGPASCPGYDAEASDPKLYMTADGRLAMVIRTLGTAWSYITFRESGAWTLPRRFCQNPNYSFGLCPLPGGEVLFVKKARYDNGKYNLTKGLFAYLTEDDGLSWHGGLEIDPWEDVLDPVCLYDGERILMAYTREDTIFFAAASRDEIARSWGSFHVRPAQLPREIFQAGRGAEATELKYAPVMKKRASFTGQPLNIGTYNIEWADFVKEPSWEQRMESIRRIFAEYDFDLVGTQEPDAPMIDSLMERLPGYKAVWILPEGYKGGFVGINPIIYKTARLELIAQGVFYYADAGDASVKGWDSWVEGRNCHWARFRDKATGEELCIFNSHLDHRGLEAKEYSPLLLQKKILEIAPDCASFCTGDFNFKENTPGYARMVSCPWISDSMTALPEEERINWEYYSMAHFKPLETVPKNHLHLDHIFFTNANSRVLGWKLITDCPDGVWGSDHLPIVVRWQVADSAR